MSEIIIERTIPGAYHFRGDMHTVLEEYTRQTLSLDEAVHRLQEIVKGYQSLDCQKCSAPGEPLILCLDCIEVANACKVCKEPAQYCSVECARDDRD